VRVSDLANAMLDVSVLHDRSRRVRFELSNTPSLYIVHVPSSDSREAASRLMAICFDDTDFLRARFSGVDANVSFEP